MSKHTISYDQFKKEPYMLYEFMDYEELDINCFLNSINIEHPLFILNITRDLGKLNSSEKSSYNINIKINKKINKEIDYIFQGAKKYCSENYNIELWFSSVKTYNLRDKKKSYSSDIELEFSFTKKITDRNFAYDFEYIEYIGIELRHLLESEIFPIFENYKTKLDHLTEFLNSK